MPSLCGGPEKLARGKQLPDSRQEVHQLQLIRRAAAAPAAVGEFQRQFPIFDIPPGGRQQGRSLLALLADENDGAVGGPGQTIGAGQPVERVLVRHFAQVVNDQQTDVAAVGQFFQCGGILIVVAVGCVGTGNHPYLLQRVNNDQPDARVLGQHLIQLLLQPLPDHGRMAAKVQTGGRFLGQTQCAGVQPPRPVLQCQIEYLTFPGTEPEKGFSPADRQAELQRQPAFSHFGRAAQEVQAGCQQSFRQPGDGFHRVGVEFLEGIGFEFV